MSIVGGWVLDGCSAAVGRLVAWWDRLDAGSGMTGYGLKDSPVPRLTGIAARNGCWQRAPRRRIRCGAAGPIGQRSAMLGGYQTGSPSPPRGPVCGAAPDE